MNTTLARKAVADTQARLAADMPYLQAATKNGLGGSARAWMRRWVLDFAGDVCVICGEAGERDASPKAPNYLHLGHLISAEEIADATGTDISDQGRKGGYRAGNLASQHRACNLRAGTSRILASSLARPDLVPLDLPTFHKYGAAKA